MPNGEDCIVICCQHISKGWNIIMYPFAFVMTDDHERTICKSRTTSEGRKALKSTSSVSKLVTLRSLLLKGFWCKGCYQNLEVTANHLTLKDWKIFCIKALMNAVWSSFHHYNDPQCTFYPESCFKLDPIDADSAIFDTYQLCLQPRCIKTRFLVFRHW